MGDAEDVLALVGGIYDAALDPALWPAVLLRCAGFVGGAGAGLYSKDISQKSGGLFYQDGGIPDEYVRLYFEKYIKFDPSTTTHFFAEIGNPVSTTDMMDYDEFRQTRFFREWAIPQGLVDHISVVLDKTATSVAMFGVFRRGQDGIVGDDTRERMRMLAPHVRRAVLIGRAVELKSVEKENLARALDGLAAAMFLLDAEGRVVHANAAGVVMLNDDDVLRANGGRASAVDPDDDLALREACLAATRGDAAIGSRGVALGMMSRGGEHHVAHVLPLASDTRRRAMPATASVALFVRKAEFGKVAAPEAIAKAYRLTPSELRVLLAAVETGGTAEIAEALGIAETTVKFHLRSLFTKTGVNRQADLVKIVAGFAGPLAG